VPPRFAPVFRCSPRAFVDTRPSGILIGVHADAEPCAAARTAGWGSGTRRRELHLAVRVASAVKPSTQLPQTSRLSPRKSVQIMRLTIRFCAASVLVRPSPASSSLKQGVGNLLFRELRLFHRSSSSHLRTATLTSPRSHSIRMAAPTCSGRRRGDPSSATTWSGVKPKPNWLRISFTIWTCRPMARGSWVHQARLARGLPALEHDDPHLRSPRFLFA